MTQDRSCQPLEETVRFLAAYRREIEVWMEDYDGHDLRYELICVNDCIRWLASLRGTPCAIEWKWIEEKCIKANDARRKKGR